jgi:hypothetical protein
MCGPRPCDFNLIQISPSEMEGRRKTEVHGLPIYFSVEIVWGKVWFYPTPDKNYSARLRCLREFEQ